MLVISPTPANSEISSDIWCSPQYVVCGAGGSDPGGGVSSMFSVCRIIFSHIHYMCKYIVTTAMRTN